MSNNLGGLQVISSVVYNPFANAIKAVIAPLTD